MGPFDQRLVRRADAVRPLLAVDAGAGVVATLLLLAQATVLAAVVARVVGGDAVPASWFAALVAFVAVRALLAVVVERTGRRAAGDVMSSLRAQLVARRLRVDAPAGDLDAAGTATAAVQGVDGLEVYFAKYLPQLVLAVLVPIAVLVWTAAVDLTSAVIMLLTLPVIPIFMWLIGVATANRASANLAALEALAGQFLDVLRGLPTLRAFNRGRAQVPRIEEATERYRTTTMGVLRLSFLSGAVLDFATTISIALVAVTLGVRLVEGDLALRPALTVLLLVPELYAPIRQVGTLFHASADGLAGARRILDLLDEEPELVPVPVGVTAPGVPAEPASPPSVAPTPPPPHSSLSVQRFSGESPDRPAGSDGGSEEGPAGAGAVAGAGATGPGAGHGAPGGAGGRSGVRVEVRGVTVAFAGRPVPALDHVDLDLAPGEVLAVVGPSGAGKTTLGRVALGLLVPDAGTVTADGEPLADPAARDAWRHRVSWASQRPALVHGTVARNLALGDPGMDRAAVEAAARRAGAHELVLALPQGYDTVIGGGGRGLSAGQRQRIGLARALARPADLVVLDEPTAHLDAVAATTVADAVAALRGRATVLLLTHDDRLVAVADRVVALDDGRLTGNPTLVPTRHEVSP